jgi:hypothetical protein
MIMISPMPLVEPKIRPMRSGGLSDAVPQGDDEHRLLW